MDLQPAHALNRFGLGQGGTEAPPADPTAWLAAQLDAPDPARFAANLPGTATTAPFRGRLVWPRANHLIVGIRQGRAALDALAGFGERVAGA